MVENLDYDRNFCASSECTGLTPALSGGEGAPMTLSVLITKTEDEKNEGGGTFLRHIFLFIVLSRLSPQCGLKSLLSTQRKVVEFTTKGPRLGYLIQNAGNVRYIIQITRWEAQSFLK